MAKGNKESESGHRPDMRCELVTVDRLALMLKMNKRTVWRLSSLAAAGQGDFPRPLRLGPKTVRWRLTDIQAYLSKLAGDEVRP